MEDRRYGDLGEQKVVAHPLAQYKGRAVPVNGQLAHHQIEARAEHAAQIDQIFLQGGGNFRRRHLRRFLIDRGKILLHGVFEPLKHKNDRSFRTYLKERHSPFFQTDRFLLLFFPSVCHLCGGILLRGNAILDIAEGGRKLQPSLRFTGYGARKATGASSFPGHLPPLDG